MSDLIRESAIGQVIRYVTRNKVLRYPEEDPNFKIPWEEAALQEKEKAIETGADAVTPPAANRDPELANISHTISLAMIPTAASSGRLQAVASRIMSREQTVPYSAERFEVEREESEMRATSTIIQPQKTTDGVTLVDWYTTGDPANPQNWSSMKKAYVGFLVFIYTFAVYAGSAIYTSSEPGVMEKFGVGQSKASLGLSMYAIFCLQICRY
jgi:DHA1 family multidrug resistance protein-like MFS transporter